LAIDIGGTNLRVAFVELSAFGDHLPSTPGNRESSNTPVSRVQRRLEKSWPIGNHLKNEQADHLFDWIGTCIAEVVEDGKIAYGNKMPAELSMGVTFSFPMM
jgi:hexokinase